MTGLGLGLRLGLLTLLMVLGGAASAQPRCLDYARGKKLGRMDSKRIDEASGLVASLAQPGIYWVHNDSGDSDRIFAISEDGDYYGQWNLRGGHAEDWEDIALGPCDDGLWSCLYLADTGNNDGARELFTLYRVREPRVDTERHKPHDAKTDERAEAFAFTYPSVAVRGGEAPDVEALLIGEDGAAYLFSKTHQGVTLFRLWLEPWPLDGELAVAEELGTREDIDFITGADLAPDGGRFVIRGAKRAWEFAIAPGESVAEAFFGVPLEVRLRHERQGEAIAYRPDGRALLSTSEGDEPPIYRYRCAWWWGEDEGDKADGALAPPVADAVSESPGGCAGGPAGAPPAWASALALALALLFGTRWRRARAAR